MYLMACHSNVLSSGESMPMRSTWTVRIRTKRPHRCSERHLPSVNSTISTRATPHLRQVQMRDCLRTRQVMPHVERTQASTQQRRPRRLALTSQRRQPLLHSSRLSRTSTETKTRFSEALQRTRKTGSNPQRSESRPETVDRPSIRLD